MNVVREKGSLRIQLHSFVPKSGTLVVAIGDRPPVERQLDLVPLELWGVSLPLEGADEYSVSIPELGLHEAFPREERLLRPFATAPRTAAAISAMERRLEAARELSRARRYGDAGEELAAILAEEPRHRGALTALAELELRRARYAEGLAAIDQVLQTDTYDPRANWIAGTLHRASADLVNAKECFGWAARSAPRARASRGPARSASASAASAR